MHAKLAIQLALCLDQCHNRLVCPRAEAGEAAINVQYMFSNNCVVQCDCHLNYFSIICLVAIAINHYFCKVMRDHDYHECKVQFKSTQAHTMCKVITQDNNSIVSIQSKALITGYQLNVLAKNNSIFNQIRNLQPEIRDRFTT